MTGLRISWPSPPSAVVKLGGSLLDLPDIPARLSRMRGAWGPRPLLVVGGGPAADLVREWDRVHIIGERRAHDLAVRSLDLTAALIETCWPEAVTLNPETLQSDWEAGRVPIVSVRSLLAEAHAKQIPQPAATWATTTDTLAAWIAGQSGADCLWLLKSVAAPDSLQAATTQGAVDPEFWPWCRQFGLAVYWVNARNDNGLVRGESEDPPQEISY